MMDNRYRLITCAEELIARHGYDAVSVQEIVELAGITKPTLYHYFGSKQGLVNTIIEEEGAALLAQVRAAAHYDGDVSEAIKRLFRAYFEYAACNPVFYRMTLTMWFAPPGADYYAAIQRLHRAQHEAIAAMFEQAGQHHGNMRGRQQQYAVSLRGLIDTYIGLWLQGLFDVQDEAQLHRIVHQYMYGIFS